MSGFKKTTKQTEAIGLLASMKKYVALFGGSRSGKTFIIIYALIVRACMCPNSRHAVVRATFNAAKRSIFLDTLPKVLNICFPDLVVKWNKTDYYILFPNGSELWIFGVDKHNVDRILGMEFSSIYFNEASEFEYRTLQTVISRLAQKNSLKKRVWFDFNPPVKTHWSYWLFIKLLDPIQDEPLANPDEYGSLLMNPGDNLENIDEEYIAILERMPPKDRQRFLLGEFSDNNDGAAYYSFNRDTHVKKTTPMIGTMFISMDFNVNPMTASIFQIIDRKMVIHDEVYLENSDTYKMCDALKKKGVSGGKVIPDSTGRNRKTSGKSDFDILRAAGFEVMPTRNPFVTDRVNNMNRMFTNDLIQIDPKCKKLINDFEKVVWKNNNLDQTTDKMLTHSSDNAGYGAYKLLPPPGVAPVVIQFS